MVFPGISGDRWMEIKNHETGRRRETTVLVTCNRTGRGGASTGKKKRRGLSVDVYRFDSTCSSDGQFPESGGQKPVISSDSCSGLGFGIRFLFLLVRTRPTSVLHVGVGSAIWALPIAWMTRVPHISQYLPGIQLGSGPGDPGPVDKFRRALRFAHSVYVTREAVHLFAVNMLDVPEKKIRFLESGKSGASKNKTLGRETGDESDAVRQVIEGMFGLDGGPAGKRKSKSQDGNRSATTEEEVRLA